MGIGGTGGTVGLAEVAIAVVEVVSSVACSTDCAVPVTVVAIGGLAELAGGRKAAVAGGTLLAGSDASLTLVAMQTLAGDALVVDELISILAGEALAGRRVCLTARYATKGANTIVERVVASGG